MAHALDLQQSHGAHEREPGLDLEAEAPVLGHF
jgi:hypothetical protein